MSMTPDTRYSKESAPKGAQNRPAEMSAELVNGLTQQIEALTALTAEVKALSAGSAQKSSPQGEADAAKEPKTIDLIGFLFRLLERFWLIALAAILGTVGAWYHARSSVPIYSATAKMYIVSPGDSLINFSDLQLGTVLTLDYQEVFKTWEVHEMVRKELNLDYTYSQMQSMIGVSNPEDTRVLYLTAVHSDPQMAADIANAYARAAKVFITNSMRGEEPTDFSIALVPSVPLSSGKRATIIKGFLLGTVLAVGLLFVQYILDDRPQNPEDILNAAGIPTLAILPSVKEVKRKARQTKRRHQHSRRTGQNENTEA